MKTTSIVLMGMGIIPLLAGCASQPLAVGTVGPASFTMGMGGTHGCLQVFSASQKSIPAASDDNRLFDLPTSYEIHDPAGRFVRYVPNHLSNQDQWPDLVSLPAGDYEVVAESTWCGLVTVPVVIEDGKTTTVHLDDNWFPSSKLAANQLVVLPNGEAVGWSDAATHSTE